MLWEADIIPRYNEWLAAENVRKQKAKKTKL